MSSTATGRTPRTDAEWAREIHRRVAKLEDPSAARIGDWVITSRAGELVAARNGEVVPLLNPAQEIDRDAVKSIVRSAGYATQESLDQTNETVTEHTGSLGTIGTQIGDIFEDLTDLFTGQGTQLDEIEDIKTRLDLVEATSAVTPAYAADINDMPTCSRDDLIRWVISGGVTQTSLGGHSHTFTTATNTVGTTQLGFHNHGDSFAVNPAPAIYTPPRVIGSATAPVDFTPIVVDRKGKVRMMRWRVGNDPSIFGIDAYYMGLCVYNKTNGNIEKVWDSGDIKDGVANTTSLAEVGINMGLDQTCVPGQILFIAHQQIAPGVAQATRSFACKPQAGGPARPGQLLHSWYFRSGNLGSIPSSIPLSSLSGRNDCIPWGAISVDSEAA